MAHRKPRLGVRGFLRAAFHVAGSVVVGATIVIGRDYFERQAETLLKLAKSVSDVHIAASLTQRAADLKALVEELGAAPDPCRQVLDAEEAP